MRLDELFDRSEWTFAVHSWPDGLWRHLLAHVLGGAAWFALGVVLLQLHDWRSAAFVGVAELIRQELCREIKGRNNYPLWAILIDTGTALLTGIGLSLVWRG